MPDLPIMPDLPEVMPDLPRLCQIFRGYARSSEVMPGLRPGLLRLCQIF